MPGSAGGREVERGAFRGKSQLSQFLEDELELEEVGAEKQHSNKNKQCSKKEEGTTEQAV